MGSTVVTFAVCKVMASLWCFTRSFNCKPKSRGVLKRHWTVCIPSHASRTSLMWEVANRWASHLFVLQFKSPSVTRRASSFKWCSGFLWVFSPCGPATRLDTLHSVRLLRGDAASDHWVTAEVSTSGPNRTRLNAHLTLFTPWFQLSFLHDFLSFTQHHHNSFKMDTIWAVQLCDFIVKDCLIINTVLVDQVVQATCWAEMRDWFLMSHSVLL